MVPSTWRRVQDWTHLTLLCGVVASILLTMSSFYAFYGGCSSFLCIKELLALVFMMPCMFYFIRIIGQYDDRLQSKQLEAKEHKEQLTKAYNDTLADMDSLLAQSAESSMGLAERSFESKRRDFQRFLERAKTRYTQLYSGSKAEGDDLLMHFRKFVCNWLKVFEECSIDPIQYPKRVATESELDRCSTIAEVADLALERLRVTEVRFISIQRDQDQQMLGRSRQTLQRLTVSAGRSALGLQNLEAGNSRTLISPLPAAAEARSGARMTWLMFGSGNGFRINAGKEEGGYPKEVRFGCGRVVVLSREHATLLMAFLVGWLILLMELMTLGSANGKTQPLVFLEVALSEVCLVVLMYRFEEIDVIQQLEREVRELRKAEEQIKGQREKMREFWNNAQQLTELWLYRTVPRLDLYKEVHSHLEDTPKEELIDLMRFANKQLLSVEANLGELGMWRNDGALSLENKKNFGATVNRLCQEQALPPILTKLDDVTSTNMKYLQAARSLGPGGR